MCGCSSLLLPNNNASFNALNFRSCIRHLPKRHVVEAMNMSHLKGTVVLEMFELSWYGLYCIVKIIR